MSMLEFNLINTAAVALSAATAKTIVAGIAPTNQRFIVKEWSVTFDGVTASAVPVLCELVYSSGAGAGTSTSLTPTKQNPIDAETIQSTAKENYTAEPTTITVLDSMLISPTSGMKEIRPALRGVMCPGGKTLGIRCTAPATVNVRGTMKCEE